MEEGANVKPSKTGEILPGVFAVSNIQVNFYLIKGEQKYIAFDAGASRKMSEKGLARLNIRPDDICAVFLTHTDSDHTSSLGLFPHAKVYIAKQEVQMIDGSTKRSFLLGYNKLHCTYETFVDGETCIVDGAEIKCMVTPGHTKGSACYVVNGKYLFSGDSFSMKNGKAERFTPLYTMDGAEQDRSIRKLAGISGIEAAFTGHHGYTDNYDKAMQDWH